jgi:hypothetical protein
MYILYILERLSLAAPWEYIHSGLVLGLDKALCQLSSILYPPCFSWPTQQLVICPTIHISHVHPPLTIRWLNTTIQVNNMGAWHLMYNIHHITLLHNISSCTSSTLLDKPAGPKLSCQEQLGTCLLVNYYEMQNQTKKGAKLRMRTIA